MTKTQLLINFYKHSKIGKDPFGNYGFAVNGCEDLIIAFLPKPVKNSCYVSLHSWCNFIIPFVYIDQEHPEIIKIRKRLEFLNKL